MSSGVMVVGSPLDEYLRGESPSDKGEMLASISGTMMFDTSRRRPYWVMLTVFAEQGESLDDHPNTRVDNPIDGQDDTDESGDMVGFIQTPVRKTDLVTS